MDKKQDSHKYVCTYGLENGLTVNTTFEVKFDKAVEINSEEYKSSERGVEEIVTLIKYRSFLLEHLKNSVDLK